MRESYIEKINDEKRKKLKKRDKRAIGTDKQIPREKRLKVKETEKAKSLKFHFPDTWPLGLSFCPTTPF